MSITQKASEELAEHEDAPGWTNVVGDEDALVYACSCGTYSPVLARESIGEKDVETAADWHREHVAGHVSAVVLREARAVLEGMLDGFPQHGRHTRAGWATEYLVLLAERATSPSPAPNPTETGE